MARKIGAAADSGEQITGWIQVSRVTVLLNWKCEWAISCYYMVQFGVPPVGTIYPAEYMERGFTQCSKLNWWSFVGGDYKVPFEEAPWDHKDYSPSFQSARLAVASFTAFTNVTCHHLPATSVRFVDEVWGCVYTQPLRCLSVGWAHL